jgi:hypothetical protein
METPLGYNETVLNDVGLMINPHGLRVSTFDSVRPCRATNNVIRRPTINFSKMNTRRARGSASLIDKHGMIEFPMIPLYVVR